MRHELDPEGGQDVEKGGFQIIAVGARRKIGGAHAVIAAVTWRLFSGEQFTAYQLGVWFQQIKTVTMAIPRQLSEAQT
ncbi:MAG: hypothetical protein WBM84_02090, partial [Sedimenticolaceae bacterium]